MEFIGKAIATVAVSIMIIAVGRFVPEHTIGAIVGGTFISVFVWGS